MKKKPVQGSNGFPYGFHRKAASKPKTTEEHLPCAKENSLNVPRRR
jgi:hypothetical protein